MTYLRLKIGPMPDFLTIQRHFVGSRLEFLSTREVGDTVVSVITVHANDVGAVIGAMHRWDDHDVTLIEKRPGFAILRLRGPVPAGYRVISDIEMAPLYPICVADGYLIVEYLLPAEEVSPFRDALVRRGVRFIVAEMSPRYDIAAGVTDRQRQVVNLAVAEGYYDIPRRVSQAGIAARLGVDKSVVNRILRRAERHLITAAASRWSDLPHR